ncbi:MAG: hypothetical protein PHF60_04895 [Candidatus ainarchaeum sp.]|nr:hypothetical protein [Candidatus ainarchaeum sp.]
MRLAIFVLFVCAAVWAAPAPPEIIVNNQTMECSQFNAGDECMNCEIPEGWTSLGYNTRECPTGYTEVNAPRNCSGFKIGRCCSVGHSGALGECDDMIVNHLTMQCMFNEGGTVPPGWEGKPEGTDAWDWQCPEGYGWPEEGLPGGPCPCTAAFLLSGLVLLISTNRS